MLSLARGAGAQDGFFCSFFWCFKFWDPQNPQHPQDRNHKTWRGQLVEQVHAEDLAQTTHDLLSITQVWGTITEPLRAMLRTARVSVSFQVRFACFQGPCRGPRIWLERTDLGTDLGTDFGTDSGTDFLNPIFLCQTKTDFSPLKIPLFLRDVPGPCSSDSLADKNGRLWMCWALPSVSACGPFVWNLTSAQTRVTRPGKTLDRVSPTQTHLRDYKKITSQDLPWYLRLAETRSSLLLQPWPSRSKPKQKNKKWGAFSTLHVSCPDRCLEKWSRTRRDASPQSACRAERKLNPGPRLLPLPALLSQTWFGRKFANHNWTPRFVLPPLFSREKPGKFIRTGGFRCGSRTFARTSHVSDWIVGRGTDPKTPNP